MAGDSPSDPVAEVLAAVPDPLRGVVDAVRDLIHAMHPTATVLAWPKQKIISFGVGPKKHSQHYAYLGVFSRHINLGFYRGAWLPDPASLLEGTGQNMRHVKLADAAEAASAPIKALIEAAIRDTRAQGRQAAR